ncbi:glycosyltransferase family 9 protein [Nocardioides sp. WG-D5]
MRTLVVRLDSMGDVLLAGPAVRAMAATSDHLTMLCGPLGREAAELLPGVDEVLCWEAPWIAADPPPVDADEVDLLRKRLEAGQFDRAVVLTSFHQSPLPTALVLRLAGVGRVAAVSTDYPGSLLDHRVHVEEDIPEPERALAVATACGGRLPDGDDGRLAVSVGLRVGRAPDELPVPYVALHPGTSAPARAWPPDRFRELAEQLSGLGLGVVVTGGPGERRLTAYVAGDRGTDLGGTLGLDELAGVLGRAEAVVVGNTGPAHLAAAVGTPVVSLYAPTISAERWAPYGVDRVLLGDQHAPCRDTRARECPVPGHPCLTSVTPDVVVTALGTLGVRPSETVGRSR